MPTSDPWVWRAVYADGATLDEVDDDAPDGRGWDAVMRYAEARGTRLASVVLLPTRAGLCTHVVTLAPDGPNGNATLRIFRRRSLTLDSGSGAEVGERPDAITALALTFSGDTDRHTAYTAYTFLFSDGSVVLSDDLNAV